MSKKQFFSKLRKRLSILKKEEIDDILEEYEGHINEKVLSGKTEEEAIKDFGDFDELVKEILSAYKINEDYDKPEVQKNIFMDYIDGFVDFIKQVVDNISKRSKSDIFKFIFELFVLIIFIAILKIPVTLIKELGSRVFELLIFPFGKALSFIWSYMVEFIYLILAVIGIINFVKKRYLEEKTETFKSQNNKEVKKMNEVKKDKPNEKKSNDTFLNVILVILKVCVALILIPAIFSFIGSFICLIIGIGLILNGVSYFGILLCVITYVLLNYIFIDICFRFILNKKINLKVLVSFIIITLVISCIGISMAFYEVINTTFVNGVDDISEKKVYEKKIAYNDNLDVSCHNIYYTGVCNYVIDDSLGNDVLINVEYYEYMNAFVLDDNLNYKIVENNEFSIKKIFDIVLKDLKTKTIHNYDKLDDLNITIKVSSEVKQKIDQKTAEKYNNNYLYDDYD